ncbi:uncharacterized protein LOC133840136 [Drosophila sulfurigaster albostrigata]|uniref:uncharacterized protein LOC133840136 n=1 Tax=Drosophila sulfurigaster albostrigata TaxID=89887 RepID=UPI002D21BF05|nr:uncharacterized protein LOC133840136 [Drosophila sulfurigaster albostrigata]
MLADTLGMPPTRPDEEEILVINECKLEQSESQAERLERATIPPAEAEPDSELDVKLDVDTTTSPQLEVSIAISSPIPGELLTNESVAEEDRLSTAKELIQNVEHEELPEIDQQPEPEKEVEQLQQVEMQVEQQSQVVIEQADKQMSESQADVNQDLVQQQTSGQNIEPQLKSDEGVVMVQKPHLKEQKENELETDAEEDLTTKQRQKGFCSGNKSLFLNFNKLCNKLKSRRSHFSMSGSTNSIGSSTRKNVKDKETQIESKSVPQEAVDENTALSSLLVAQPCPPCYQQQQQLNAAGVGELLCAKTPLTTLDVPGVINCNSELGQQINQISLADASIPLITSETVPLPVATNDDYVITQSIAKYYEGPIPAEINLSIEPRPTSSPPKEDRTQNAGNLEHSVATREELQESYLPISVALSQRIRDVLREQPAPSDTNQTISLTTLEEATINAPEANNNTSICTIFDTGFTAKNNENTEAKPNPAEEATADALQPNQQKLINLVKASKSAQSVAQLNADEIELPIAPAKLTVAGKQMVVSPHCHFVPKELRYKCGVPDCGQHFDSELGFSQHLSTQHNHRDVFKCPHCTRTRANHSLILEKVLEHLAYHKRYVYQCGACSSFATKFSIMDRHISKMHASKFGVDVDVIIHKRDDLTTHTKPTDVRWFKSVNVLRTSTDEWFCNLCPTALATEHQMIGHAEMSHQRKHQYCCPYCDYGFKDPIKIVNHIRCSHAGKRIQPLQCYRRIKSYKPYTLCFICNTCHEATNTIRKMANHCQVAHSNRFQYKCRHCDFGHNNHHLVVAHMTQEHPGMPGLLIQQFDRLDNDMLDVDFWNKALIFLPKSRMEPPKPVETAQPEPVLPKLLVRLVPEPEQATQIESNSVPQEAVDENTALSSLLVAQPCPPCYQQQQQLNAAGVGELLCAKTPLTTLDVPGVINCNSELGQQINQISLADASIPLITSETVPLPVATNDDYVITQSIAKYYEGPIPAEINLSIEPRPTSSPPKEDRTQNAGNLEHSVATREELQESYLPISVALSQRIRDVLREQPAPSDTNQTISLTTLEEATINAPEANNNTSICTIFDTGFTAKNNENTEAKPNPAEEATADALQPNQQKLINLVKASKSAQSVAQLNADEIELPIAPTKLTVAGKQMVVLPRCHFVPKELRYKCGVPDCGQHFDSELGFSQHLSTQHHHGDSFMCPHCNFKNHSLILEKVLEHLAYHKRYIYQCGACSSFATKFSIMDRHISKMHASKLGVDVDVIIHKRDDLTTHTRWFKSVNLRTSTDEWFCNLCPTTLATEHQMIGHTELSHQRKHQYCCPYCDYGFKDPINIANHIRCSHAGKRIQPLQCYRRIKSYKPYTLGFICNTCHEATNTIRKMANHCQFAHSNRFQYKCRHCDFGHNNHHLVVAHMTQEHPGMPGLPIQQFDRLDNDMLDVDFWNKALIFLPKKPHGAT